MYRPYIEVFQDFYYFISILDKCNDRHLRSTHCAFKWIYFINFIYQLRPGFPAGFFRWGIINNFNINVVCIFCFQSQFFSLSPRCVSVKAIIPNQRFIGIGNMKADTVKEFNGIQHLKITFLTQVHPRLVNDRSGILVIFDFISKKCGMNYILSQPRGIYINIPQGHFLQLLCLILFYLHLVVNRKKNNGNM